MNLLKQLFLVVTLIFGYVTVNSVVDAKSHHSKKKDKAKKAKAPKKAKSHKKNKKSRHSHDDALNEE